jgi:hypothetical protein
VQRGQGKSRSALAREAQEAAEQELAAQRSRARATRKR